MLVVNAWPSLVTQRDMHHHAKKVDNLRHLPLLPRQHHIQDSHHGGLALSVCFIKSKPSHIWSTAWLLLLVRADLQPGVQKRQWSASDAFVDPPPTRPGRERGEERGGFRNMAF